MWALLLVEAGAVWVAPTTPGRENTDSKFCVSNRLGGNLALAVQSLGVGGVGPPRVVNCLGGVRLLGSAGGQRLPVGPIPLFNRIFPEKRVGRVV